MVGKRVSLILAGVLSFVAGINIGIIVAVIGINNSEWDSWLIGNLIIAVWCIGLAISNFYNYARIKGENPPIKKEAT